MSFNKSQKQAIAAGAKKRARLITVAMRAAKPTATKPTYIYSPPGLGKTFTVNEAIAATKTTFFNISGNISMFAFGVQLATIAYLDQTSDQIVINIDDCDEVLKNEMNINIMKNMLVGNKIYSYNKNMSSQMSNLSEVQQAAIQFHSDPRKMGFDVPTDRFQFIFTSNFRLPFDDEVADAVERGRTRSVMMGHRNAIRSRCQTNDFALEWSEQWGWIADVVMNTPVVDDLKTQKEKEILLNWMYDNWDDMTERSIRTAEKMAEAMIEDPTGYINDWEIDLLK